MSRTARVVVVGGGVTGLVAAHRLAAAGERPPVDVTLVESSPRVGGKLRTGEVAGLLVETGPDSFVVRKPWAVDLCTELGLGPDLVVPGVSGAFVWARGRMIPFPQGTAFGVPADVETILRWPGLSVKGRLAAALEPLRGARSGPPTDDEPVRDLLVRRLGREAADVLAGPVLAGIHAGDPARMSAAATFPELRAWEGGHGSLIRGARASIKAGRKQRPGPRPLFTTVDGGLDRLVDAIASQLGSASVLVHTHVDRIARAVETPLEVVAGERRIPADVVVVATPAAAASATLAHDAPRAASTLRELRTVSTATVTLVYPPGTGARLPEATGLLVPPGRAGADPGAPAPRVVTACTWLSRKWPDALFGDRALVRGFVGRDGDAAALELDDHALAAAVAADVELTTPLGAAPEAALVTRWPAGMPQYDVGHLDRVLAAADDMRDAVPGVFLAGAAYGGIGIADCVHQGNEVAEEVRAFLDERARAGAEPRSEDATTRS